MSKRRFIKMHGLGNDFVIIDARVQAFQPTPEQAQRLADRRQGVGCDQLIVLEPSARADIFMRIYNADGSQAEACRCGGASARTRSASSGKTPCPLAQAPRHR